MLTSVLELCVILALVFANGFFVAAEFALVKVRTSQLRPLLKDGGWRVKFAIKATEHLDSVLSATQFGITLASLALGWVGEPFLAKHLKPVLSLVGITDATAVTSISFAGAFAIITFFHIILGELAPKSLALQQARSVSLFTAAPLMFFYYLFYPFIWLLNSTANLFLRFFGISQAEEHQHTFSKEELEYVFSHAPHASATDALVDRIMVQTIRGRQTTARQIMIPVEDAVFLDINDGSAKNIFVARAGGHSRYPVCKGSKDNVLGLLLTREWLWQMHTLGTNCDITPILYSLLTFNPGTPVLEMLERFRSERRHLGIVRDTAQHVIGIVTLEDVLEEIVGDIRDESELTGGLVFSRGLDEIVVHPDILLRDLQTETGWALENFDLTQSVGDWLAKNCARMRARNESTVFGEFRITLRDVEEKPPRRIRRVSFRRLTEAELEEIKELEASHEND